VESAAQRFPAEQARNARQATEAIFFTDTVIGAHFL
jgi:hypothetical protein